MNAVENTSVQELRPLAREMAAALAHMLDFYQKHYKLPLEGALARHYDRAEDYEALLDTKPTDQWSWYELNFLCERNPDKGLQKWEEIKQAALDELQSGHRASIVMETHGPGPWERARFLAILAELHDGWQPRNGIERQLLNSMAQAQACYEFWLNKLSIWSAMEAVTDERLRLEGTWLPPRLRDNECVNQAAEMADRCNKIFLRTLRALRDLRRYHTPVIVKNAGQVNVGGQQVNVSS